MKDAPIIVNGKDGHSISARNVRGMTLALLGVSDPAQRQFWDFFTVRICNPNTRRTYVNPVWRFADCCGHHGVPLAKIEPAMVAAGIEERTRMLAPARLKLHLVALRMLFHCLVANQVLPFNPASSIRGPKHVVKEVKTPVLSAEEARRLRDGVDISMFAVLRERALIVVLVVSFAQITAAAWMPVPDYYTQGGRLFFRQQ